MAIAESFDRAVVFWESVGTRPERTLAFASGICGIQTQRRRRLVVVEPSRDDSASSTRRLRIDQTWWLASGASEFSYKWALGLVAFVRHDHIT